MRITGSSWSERELETLADGIRAGLTASQIAGLMPRRSRSAVIGKVHRMLNRGQIKVGLGGATKERRIPQEERAAKLVALTKARREKARKPKPKRVSRPPIELLDVVAGDLGRTPFDALSRRLALAELEPGDCRWPSAGLGPVTFCGHPKAPCSSYCAHHTQRAQRENDADPSITKRATPTRALETA